MRKTSAHTVAIRETREDVLTAVRKEFGILFTYWQLASNRPPGFPEGNGLPGVAYIVADDVLLPTRNGVKVLAWTPPVEQNGVGSTSKKRTREEEEATEREQRGEGRVSLPVSFTT